MAQRELLLPVLQNWSCHNCGGCCREHAISITEAEKQRIEQQGWTTEHGIPADKPWFVDDGRKQFRLAHADDGGCVFLDDQGLCRIHARFGEAAKPLACRLYPYAFHPNGEKSLAVSLRFSCPSVTQNLGSPVIKQQGDLQALSKQVTASVREKFSPPSIHRGGPHGEQTVSWNDFHKIVESLVASLQDESVHFAVRLLRTLAWLDLVEQSQFQTVRGEKLDDYLEVVTSASVTAQPDNDLPVLQPSRIGRTMFRLLVGQMARHDTETQRRAGLGYRIGLAKAAVKFVTGWGVVPELAGSASVEKAFPAESSSRPARFADLESDFKGRNPAIDELLARYFEVKLRGIHFCGPGLYDTTLVDGFRYLAMMYPSVLWLARGRAFRGGRNQLQLTDVQAALATADHNFGFSPALGTPTALRRISQLASMKQIECLVGWYSR